MNRGSPFSDTDELKMTLRARKVSGALDKRAPEEDGTLCNIFCLFFLNN